MMTFCFALISMSFDDSILMTLLTESMTILFFPPLSTSTIFSAPSLSSNTRR